MTLLEEKLTKQLAECKAVCEKINAEQQDIIRQCREVKEREHQAADMLLGMAKERDEVQRLLSEAQLQNHRLLSALTMAIEGNVRGALLVLISVNPAPPTPVTTDYDDDPPESEP
jgi:hypothetical protein